MCNGTAGMTWCRRKPHTSAAYALSLVPAALTDAASVWAAKFYLHFVRQQYCVIFNSANLPFNVRACVVIGFDYVSLIGGFTCGASAASLVWLVIIAHKGW